MVIIEGRERLDEKVVLLRPTSAGGIVWTDYLIQSIVLTNQLVWNWSEYDNKFDDECEINVNKYINGEILMTVYIVISAK